ncbi:hypothetical protein MXD59_22945 [Frankia sp. Ag45/Mut15]|uniref:Uncharacterized protein n=1 Tax=Frankia umida TaxID=573489 RepID=A0ABT0K470_9ACTN|nr:hypothetical protein [Frankia umida]MCK9878585.1 hypothetical protein [Frankia umida]
MFDALVGALEAVVPEPELPARLPQATSASDDRATTATSDFARMDMISPGRSVTRDLHNRVDVLDTSS